MSAIAARRSPGGPATRPLAARSLSARVQRALVWTGPAMVIAWVISFWLLARFIPPPSPTKTAAQVVAFYRPHVGAIRLGLFITLFASALLVPFCAVIQGQMRRIPAARSALASTQMASAALLSLEFILPLMVWQTAAYRLNDTSAQMIRMLNDMGWIMFVGVISSACVQFGSLGLAILLDERPDPVFPRWAGYFNLWITLLVAPAGIIVFFKHGPFAWNGLISFFLPLAAFTAWIAVMVILLLHAIDAEEPDDHAQELPAVRVTTQTPAEPA
jgi:hypothetical protein